MYMYMWYSAVSTMRTSPEPAGEEEGAKYADLESFNALQDMLNQQQQEHERLIGTVAHLSNEMEINKEHVKVSCCMYMLSSQLHVGE